MEQLVVAAAVVAIVAFVGYRIYMKKFKNKDE